MPMRTSRCKRGAHVRALPVRRAVATVITDDRDKHFDKCGCRCHCLPAPAPHLQDKCASVSYVSPCSIVAIIIFREAILMMELPRRHAASLERAAGSHPIRVQSMGGGRGRDRAQMTYSSSGLLSGSVWQMRRLWLAAHQTPPACASIP